MRILLTGFLTLSAATFCAADIDTSPARLANVATATGSFAWDEFTAGFNGPHEPDVAATGQGTAALTAVDVPRSMDGPPFGLVTSTQNLYTGGTDTVWTTSLSGLQLAHPTTTLILQASAQGMYDLESLMIGDIKPDEVRLRGTAPAFHNIDGNNKEGDTTYLWAQWQLPAADAYDIEFAPTHSHFSLTELQVDYVNAADGALVPFPGLIGAKPFDLDLDASDQVDAADANLLCGALATSMDNSAYDANQDGQLDAADLTSYLQQAGFAAGDADFSGEVNFTDFLAISQNFGQSGNWTTGDFNCDGDVGFADFLVLSRNFGSSASAAQSVPEPNAFALGLFGLLGLIRGIRRRN